jgi:hypothetical protein
MLSSVQRSLRDGCGEQGQCCAGSASGRVMNSPSANIGCGFEALGEPSSDGLPAFSTATGRHRRHQDGATTGAVAVEGHRDAVDQHLRRSRSRRGPAAGNCTRSPWRAMATPMTTLFGAAEIIWPPWLVGSFRRITSRTAIPRRVGVGPLQSRRQADAASFRIPLLLILRIVVAAQAPPRQMGVVAAAGAEQVLVRGDQAHLGRRHHQYTR